MATHLKKITVLIPCYNEEKGIGEVIDNVPFSKLKGLGYCVEVIVIDNNSCDGTCRIAESRDARVIVEKKQGKGHAITTGFRSIPKDTDIVVMIDGDNSYRSNEMIRLVEFLDSGFCDVVIGTRLSGKMCARAMTVKNRLGNWILTFLVRVAYHGNVTDVCSGYFAWKRSVVDSLLPHLNATGFCIEMDMITKMAKLKYEIYSIPITYDERKGSSSLRPLQDGAKIFYTWAKNLTWKERTDDLNEKVSESSQNLQA